MGVGQAGVGHGIFRVDLDRVLEHLAGEFEASTADLVEELPSPQVEFVGAHVGRGHLGECAPLARRQNQLQGVGDVGCDLVLDPEHVFHVPVEVTGPEGVAVRHVDQLRVDP